METNRTIQILLIEDSLAEARLLKEILKGVTGYQFFIAHVLRLAEALQYLQQQEVNIILLDLTLPDSQGLSSLQPLLQIAPQVPIVVLTHYDNDGLALEAVRQGAQDYLVKRQASADNLIRAICYAIERKQADQHLYQLNQHLTEDIKVQAAELDKVKALNQMKSEFVSMLSHDFRNPLNTILLSAGLLEESRDRLTPEQQVTYFQMIRTAIKDMDQLLSEVLLLGRSDAGQLQCSFSPLDLMQFCQELVRSISSSRPESQRIRFTSQGNVAVGLWDAKLLRHILLNLLSNALKYSPAGQPVDFTLIGQGQQVCFQVRDYGIGIPPEAIPQLFHPFYRADNVDTIQGTGLGLAIVQKCTELHGGRVQVISELGLGSTFTVILPVLNTSVESLSFVPDNLQIR
ncbi:hybrid sensor histidine kinase/response regulator [Synechocystis sp. LKSZ1]|uniref:hybrid sensor histidine kinase/response regulator n=1 Tax=Synechocystis sp. LKSZ1 TaxID=3144951 RepID=UPI00336BD5BA